MPSFKTKYPTLYYVTADYPPDNNAGSARAKAMVEGLSDQFNVVVLTHWAAADDDHARIVRLPVRNPQSNKGLIRRTLREVMFVLCVYFRLILSARNSAMVVSSPPFLFLLLYIFLPSSRTAVRVLDVRDLYPDVFCQAGLIAKDSALYRVLSAIERRAYREADLIFTVCSTLLVKIRERSSGDKVHLVMNGFGENFSPRPSTKSRLISEKPFLVVSHGNFGRFQDVELLNRLTLETEHLPIQYRLLGFGVNFDKIKRRSNVQIEQSIQHDRIPELISGADLGLSFRTNDAIGRNAIPVKVLEYVGVGIPSLVAPIMPDLNDLARDGAIQQFEGNNMAEMVDFLTAASRGSQEFLAMSQSVSRVRKSYSRTHQVHLAAKHIVYHCKKFGEMP
jgi:glycosyl transferase family 4